MISRPRGFWGGGLVYRSLPRAPDRGLSRLYSFLQPSFFKLVQVSHPKCRPKVASSATEQCYTAALLVADGGQRNRFQPLFPISRACKANHCCKGTGTTLPCPNLACNLDFAQDDTTAPSRVKAARVSSRGASASSLATSAEATRSARLRSMRGTAANTAGCRSALEWGCVATLPGWRRPKKAGG